MMILVSCPNNNVPERSYAIGALFSDILGIDKNNYSVQFQDSSTEYIICVNDRRIIVEDHFFNCYPEPLSYLKEESIPNEVAFLHGYISDLPIIYGVDKFEKSGDAYVIGLDIFASVFFMLTRWEESLLGREQNGDCDESQLFAVKYGFCDRPIINEYASFLISLFPQDFSPTIRDYEVVLSHDVDGFLTPSWKRIFRDCIKQMIRGVPKNTVLNLTWKEEIKYRKAFPNSFRQFELYTALTEMYRISEWFYFKVCGKGEKEATYFFNANQTAKLVEWLKSMHGQRSVIGFHPSQNVLGDKRQWNNEVSRIVNLLGEKPNIGRNHHLLYNYDMLRQWEQISDNPLNISNCVFHKRHGFRSGMCTPYRLFDIYQRRVMNLIEHPCQIMDTVIRYDEKSKSEDERWAEIKRIIDRVREYRGELVLTWHIYIRDSGIINEYFKWCERVVHYAIKE